MNIDPLAELMPDQSPYNYAFNNPVFWIDPDGRMPEEGDAGGTESSSSSGGSLSKSSKEAKVGGFTNSTDSYGRDLSSSSHIDSAPVGSDSKNNSTNFQININNDKKLKETHIKVEGKLTMKITGTDTSKILPNKLLSGKGGIHEVLFQAALLWSPESGFVLNINGNTGVLEIDVSLTVGFIFNFSNVSTIQDGNISNKASFSEGPVKLDFSDGGKVSLNKSWDVSFGRFTATGSISVENLNFRNVNSNVAADTETGGLRASFSQGRASTKMRMHHLKNSGNKERAIKDSFFNTLRQF